MVDHPCLNGLGGSCFVAYPEWVRRALSYRVLHFLLPAVLSGRLGGGLGKALIGANAVVPAGVVFSAGMTIPPDFVWLDEWTPWLYLYFEGPVKPWLLFPEGWTREDALPVGVSVVPWVVFPRGWKSGDVLPPEVTLGPGAFFPEGWSPLDPLPGGVVIDHRVVLPVGFNPKVHPPAWLIPGHRSVRPRVEVGAVPPLFIQLGGGGPVHGGSGKFRPAPE